jgi:aarF domain-containing kinase
MKSMGSSCRILSRPLSLSARAPDQFGSGARIRTTLSSRSAGHSTFITPRRPGWVKYAVTLTAGGVIFYAIRRSNQPVQIHSMTHSPACIPTAVTSRRTPLIASAPDPPRSFLSRIIQLLRKHIFSPLRTGMRFLHLVFIFSPVIICAPMLFIGKAEKEHGGERWGALWWYDLLTRSMQRAGPTFIKVGLFSLLSDLTDIASASTMGGLSSRSLLVRILQSPRQSTLHNKTASLAAHHLRRRTCLPAIFQ